MSEAVVIVGSTAVAVFLVIFALRLLPEAGAEQRTSSHVVTCHTRPHAIPEGFEDMARTHFSLLKTSPEQWVVDVGVFSTSPTRHYMFLCTEEAPQ